MKPLMNNLKPIIMKKMKFYIASIILLMGLIVSCDNDDNADNTDPDLEEGISCIPDDLLGNLIAFYPFSGGSLNDFSGNNYNLREFWTM